MQKPENPKTSFFQIKAPNSLHTIRNSPAGEGRDLVNFLIDQLKLLNYESYLSYKLIKLKEGKAKTKYIIRVVVISVRSHNSLHIYTNYFYTKSLIGPSDLLRIM